MATVREAIKEATEILGCMEAEELYRPLRNLESQLPPGVYLNIHNASLSFTVRTSYAAPSGRQVKVGLGTFTDLGKAVRALLEWKNEHMMKNLKVEMIEEIRESLQVAEKAKKRNIAAQRISAFECVTPEGLNQTFFEILDTMPPHLIETDGDMNMLTENGSAITIPARVIAAWFTREEQRANAAILQSAGMEPEWKAEEPDEPDLSILL